MLHVYAYTAGDAHGPDLSDLVGIDGMALSWLPMGTLGVVVSEHDTAPVDRAAAVTHAAVIDAVMGRTAAVPLRFGHVAADPAILEATVDLRRRDLERLLADLAGRVEIALHAEVIPDVVDDPPRDEGGRAYLEGRLSQERATRAAEAAARQHLDAVTAGLEPLSRRVTDVRGSSGLERCFLVDREEAAAALRIAERLAGRTPGLRVSGPWPPYSFATSGEGASA